METNRVQISMMTDGLSPDNTDYSLCQSMDLARAAFAHRFVIVGGIDGAYLEYVDMYKH
jgi:hypothetical protein